MNGLSFMERLNRTKKNMTKRYDLIQFDGTERLNVKKLNEEATTHQTQWNEEEKCYAT